MATQPVQLQGTAIAPREGHKPFRRVTLLSEGKAVAIVDEGEIECTLAEGGTVVIESPASGPLLIEPVVTTLRGEWGELCDRPEAAGIARHVVAHSADVEIHVVRVAEGDVVEVYGEPLEGEFDDTNATMRVAPIKRSHVQAIIIAFGDSQDTRDAMTEAIAKLTAPPAKESEAAAQPQEKEGIDGEWLGVGIVVVIALGLVALVLFGGLSPIQRWRTELVLPLYIVGAFMLVPGPSLENFRMREKRIGVDFPAIVFVSMLGLPFLLLLLSMAIDGGHGRKDLRLSPPLMLVGAIVFLLLAAATVFGDHRTAHIFLAKLARAPRLGLASAKGKVGTCFGIAAHDHPVTVNSVRAALGAITDLKPKESVGPDAENTTKLVASGRFALKADGRRVLVDPKDCIWSTTSVERPKKHDLGHTMTEWIPIDGKIAVFGSYEADDSNVLHVKSTSADPAIVFSTGDDNPLILASRIVWARRIKLLVIALASVAVAVVYIHRP